MCDNKNCNENCINDESEQEPMKAILGGIIDEYEEDAVTIPRDEYSEMVAECTVLRVIEKLIDSWYPGQELRGLLKSVIDIGDGEVQE